MKVKAATCDLIVIEYTTQQSVFDGFIEDDYALGDEIVLKKLIYPDHEEWHTAEIKEMIDCCTGMPFIGIKPRIRKFFDPDSIRMNETLKIIKSGNPL